MTRLQQALQRLYLPPDAAIESATRPSAPSAPSAPSGLIGADGSVRAMVLEVGGPADWQALATVWQGVQLDLELPAPGIAVSGHDGFQLWFSLAVPVPTRVAAGFLAALQQRYLAALKPQRVRLAPTADGQWPVVAVPAPQQDAEHWSAFISADLAPMFADTPWLDMPPNRDGQANLLAALQPAAALDFQQALQRCGVGVPTAAPPELAVAAARPGTATMDDVACPPPTGAVAAGGQHDPRGFLLGVVNDATAPLALRIEAAKVLLLAPPGG